MRAVVGHAQAQATLARAVARRQVSHAYLFAGPDNIGKTTLAYAFAALLECEAPSDGDACGVCAACRKIAHGNHPDVSIIEAAEGKRQLGVEAVREQVVRIAHLAASGGGWRVFILPNVERMTANTVNALLKTLEEPPPGVVLLLTTADLDAVLPTLLSRCQVVSLRPLSGDEVRAALRERWQVEAEEARELATLAAGRLGWAAQAHEQPALREERAERLARIMALPGASRDERLRGAAALASDTEAARAALDVWIIWWRDVTLAAHGASHLAGTGAARAEAERLGRALGPARAEQFMRALLGAQTALDENANARLTFDVLMLDLPRAATAAGKARPGSGGSGR